MNWVDYGVRLFITIVFGMTCGVSLVRSVRSDDSRVVKGALLVAALTAVGVYTQIPLWHMSVDTTDWLRFILCILCLLYLNDLRRHGMN